MRWISALSGLRDPGVLRIGEVLSVVPAAPPTTGKCRTLPLDLRHRLRQIWAAALAGQIPAHHARHIAAATRHLTAAQAGRVDAQLAPSCGTVSWGRLHTLLEAKIIEADPVGAEQQTALAAQQRFVRLGRSSEHGLKMIIARATAGDAIWFKATIDRIADILPRPGDDDPIDVRRSKAIGILAQPAQALQLLCQHQHDDWDGPAEPADFPEEPVEDEDDVSFDEAAQGAEPAAHQPQPGTWLWRSPHRRIYLVNASGTHPIGDTEFAQAIWRAATGLISAIPMN